MERFDITRIRAPIGAAFLAVILAGCGDSGGDESSTASVQPAVAVSRGGAVTLSLTAPTEHVDGTPLGSGLAGYRIYWGTAIGQYPHSAIIDNPGVATYVVENLSPATWHFVATVVTKDGIESDFSNAVSIVL